LPDDAFMRFSKFNVIVYDAPEGGKTAVYNTLTQALVVLEDGVLNGLEKGEALALSAAELKALEESGIIVQEGMDEDLLFDVFYNQLRFDNSSLKITLLTTLNCNFACSYCYEGGLTLGKKRMSLETAESALSWIKERAQERKVSEILITYHGGEPLLNIPVIERIGTGLGGFCRENGIELGSHMISNGYLLDRDTARRVASAGVQSVKVTLDGPEDVHDSLRFLRGGGGTYRAIIDNLLAVKDILSIRIGGNYTKETASRIPELLDDLIENGLGSGAVHRIGFTPVMPSENNGKGAALDGGCIPMEGFHEEFIYIQREVIRRGFGTYLEPKINPCPVVNSADFTINHDGTVYKCPCLVERPRYAVGHVRDEFNYNAEMARCLGRNTFENPACRNCQALPLCLGGCRYLSLVKNGEFHGIDCQKETIIAITSEAVRQMVSSLPC
jgi:uncharacterized protein